MKVLQPLMATAGVLSFCHFLLYSLLALNIILGSQFVTLIINFGSGDMRSPLMGIFNLAIT